MSKEKVNEIIIVNYKNTDLKIDLIYRKRKNITIQIKPSGDVLLISPFNISKGYLKDVVIEKGEWILQKLEEYKLSEDLYKEKEFVSGEKFMYLGTEYILHVIKEMNEDVIIDKEKLIVKVSDLDKEYVKNKLKLWYKTQSERAVLERLIYLREKNELMLKLIPSKLKVKEQKRRWGTCTSKRAIYINSKISMAKKECIDYVLIHEFSHLVHMNHSKDFYKLVEEIMPNYREQERWLKENSLKLNF